MCTYKPLNKVKSSFKKQKGFTLVEMAISLLVLGLLLAPAISAYNLYETQKRIETTDSSVDRTTRALEGFLASNGRYPCPAPRDAVAGDADYGFEARDMATGDCIHSGTGQSGVIAVNSVNAALGADNQIMIGAVPFKTINLQENETYDGYNIRLTYAITDILTDPDTYAPNLGGISINKIDDATSALVSALALPDTGHYIVVSHGNERTGGFTSDGVRSGTCNAIGGIGPDWENCNDDNSFLISEKDNQFDDIVAFTGGVSVTPWQYADNVAGGDPNNVHLKLGGEKVLSGVTGNPASLDMMDPANQVVAAFEVRNTGYNDSIKTNCSSLPFTTICLPHVDDTVIVSGGLTARDICEANLNAPACQTGMDPSYLDADMRDDVDLVVKVEREVDTAGNPINDTGAVIANQICERDAGGNIVNCFDPTVIGGADVAGSVPTVVGAMGLPFPGTRYASGTPSSATTPIEGGNLKCPAGEFMVGIREGQIICSDTANFDCPADQVLTGVNANGELICSAAPDPPCVATNITNSCGVSDTIGPTSSGDSAFSVSGQCYMIASFDSAYANTLTSFAQIQSYVDSLNNGGRTQQDCNLVRDRYDCSSGSFSSNSDRIHEFGRYNEGFPSNINTSTNAEVPSRSGYGGPYQSFPNVLPPAFNATNNPNTDTNHDCWCREDYRIRTLNNCSDSGVRYYVDRWRCGQTRSNWQNNIWNSGGTFCTCTPSTTTQDGGSCASRIPGVPSNSPGVTGNVVDTVAVSCPYSTSLVNRSFANCTCPARSDQIPSNQTACPPGTSNSFTFEGINYTNRSFVQHRRWTCPSVSGDLDTAAEVGFWTTTSTNQTCNPICGHMSERTESCPSNKEGVRRYETTYDCTAGGYVDTGVILEDCRSCEWTKPTAGSAQYSDGNPGGRAEGSSCHCTNDSVGICKVPNGGGFDYWNDCSCDPK